MLIAILLGVKHTIIVIFLSTRLLIYFFLLINSNANLKLVTISKLNYQYDAINKAQVVTFNIIYY